MRRREGHRREPIEAAGCVAISSLLMRTRTQAYRSCSDISETSFARRESTLLRKSERCKMTLASAIFRKGQRTWHGLGSIHLTLAGWQRPKDVTVATHNR
jgi:hypothetical protein